MQSLSNILSQINIELEQAIENSISLRLKYPQQPTKFYPPQQSIDEILDRLQEHVSVQNLSSITKSQIFIPLLKLLQHPNLDLISKTIHIFYQIVVKESPDQIQQQQSSDALYTIYYHTVIWLFQKDLLSFLANLFISSDSKACFDQNKPQEYQTVLQVLKIFNYVLQIHPSHSEQLTSTKKDSKILNYISDRIMPNYIVQDRIVDDNKFVASDILIQLLQNSQTAKSIFLKMHGLQIIIQTLRPYTLTRQTMNQNKKQKQLKNKQKKLNKATYTQSSDEYQFVSNLFDCLNVLLKDQIQFEYSLSFHQCEGSDLMIWFLKQKNQHSVLAYKVLGKSLISLKDDKNNEQDKNIQEMINNRYKIAQSLIQKGLLKYLFAVLMKQGIRGSQIDQQLSIDQNSLLTINFLLRSIGDKIRINNEKDNSLIYRDRLLNKFQEDRFKKLQTLFQMYQDYEKRITQSKQIRGQQKFKQQKQEIKQLQEYMNQVKDGETVIQNFIKIIFQLIDLSYNGYFKDISKRILQLIKLYNISLQYMISILNRQMKFKPKSNKFEIWQIQNIISNQVPFFESLLKNDLKEQNGLYQNVKESKPKKIIKPNQSFI